MSVTTNIYYKGENGSAKAFAEKMISSEVAEETRKEQGNLRYEYSEPLEGKEAILLIDSWGNQESFGKRHKSAAVNKIMELRNKHNLHMKTEEFIVDNNDQDKNI